EHIENIEASSQRVGGRVLPAAPHHHGTALFPAEPIASSRSPADIPKGLPPVTIVPHEMLQELISTYGYWIIALVVGLESMGVPLPGETMLVLASIYAARDPSLNIWLVILAAAAGSILGDNAGYWIGHRYAYAAVLRYGRRFGLSEQRIKIGQYLF